MLLLLVLFVTIYAQFPVVYDINPKEVSTAGGDTLTIVGYNLPTTGSNVVALRSPLSGIAADCPLTTSSGTNTARKIYCIAPPGAGSPTVEVTNVGRSLMPLPRYPDDLFFVNAPNLIPSGSQCIQIAGPNTSMTRKMKTGNSAVTGYSDTNPGWSSYTGLAYTTSDLTTAGNFSIADRPSDNNVNFLWSGYLYLPVPNVDYTFFLISGDGSCVWINGNTNPTCVVYNNANSGGQIGEVFGTYRPTAAGYVKIDVGWWARDHDRTMNALYGSTPAGISKGTIPIWYAAETKGLNTGWVVTPNSFCTSVGRAWMEWIWSNNGAINTTNGISYKCTALQNPNDTVFTGGTPYLCIPNDVPQNLSFVYGLTALNAQTGKSCVKWQESQDPGWSNGNEVYLCVTAGTPYNGGTVPTYTYAPPTITTAKPLLGGTAEQVLLTISGTNFGPNASWVTVLVGANPCTNFQSFNRTYFICKTPVGEGLTNPITINVAGRILSSTTNFAYKPPVITAASVTPLSAYTSGGGTMIIPGTNFGTTWGNVKIGTTACTVTAWIDTQIKCTIPSGVGKQLNLTVTTFDGQSGSASFIFSYSIPIISSINPPNYTTAGNTLITIQGNSFGSAGSGTASVGGNVCTYSLWNDTYITCQLPAGQGAASPVQINVAGQVNAAQTYKYNPPLITGVSINWQTNPPQVLTISGSSLGSSGNITVNNKQCYGVSNQWFHIQVLCTLPTGTGYNVDVVMNVSNQISNTQQFSYLPIINGITTVGNSIPTLGGTEITIDGTSFTSAAVVSVTVGTFGACTALTSTPTTVKCKVPPGQGQGVGVTVTVGTQISAAYGINYDKPVLNSSTPNNGTSSGGFKIQLNGNNFGTTATVAIGGIPCDVSEQNHTQINCTVRNGQGQNLLIVVTVSLQSSTDAVTFNYFPPVLDRYAPPTNLPTDGGIPITVFGSGFTPSSIVLFGGVSITPTSSNTTVLYFTLPSGTGQKIMYIKNGLVISSGLSLVYNVPNLTAIDPIDGPTGGNIALTLTGTDFGPNPAVTLGGNPCPLVVGAPHNSSYLQCVLPRGFGTVTVQVSNNGFGGNIFTWNYSHPNITSIFNNNGPTVGGTWVNIYGVNFGLSAIVLIGNLECLSNVPGGVRLDTNILCQAPAGQGANQSIVVGLADFTSASGVWFYHYDPPVIQSLSPQPIKAPTVGGTVVTVRGKNFGTSATLSIAGVPCGVTTAAQTHSSIECIIPAGKGVNQPLVIVVSDQNNTYPFNYDSPTITSLSPLTGPTLGSVNLTLTGTSFGGSSGVAPIVKLDGNTIPAANIWLTRVNQTELVFVLSEGTGKNLVVTLDIASQVVTAPQLFTYQAPILNSATSSNCTSAGVEITDCPISQDLGKTTITIQGGNFGTDKSLATATITTEHAVLLTCPITALAEGNIECTLPELPEGGYHLLVTVNVDGLSGSKKLVSYAGPSILPNTLVRVPPNVLDTPNSLNLNSTAAGQRVRFQGKAFGLTPSAITIRYGRSSAITGSSDISDKEFGCTLDPPTLQLTATPGVFSLECDLQEGVGNALTFQVLVGLQQSEEGTDVVNYPTPTIASGSIRIYDINSSKSTVAVGQTNQGDLVFFTVGDVGSDPSLIRILFGKQGEVHDQLCFDQKIIDNHGEIVISCVTPPGFGSGYTFIVEANGNPSVEGTDEYNYALAPILWQIKAVGGCVNDNVENTTSNCPTDGMVSLSIIGDNFQDFNPRVTIGSTLCLQTLYVNTNLLTCTLPPGSGVNLPVTIQIGKLFSQAYPYLSYGSAIVTQLISPNCTNSDLDDLYDCPRAGGVSLTLVGDNFGPSNPPATVLIGGSTCDSVVHDSTSPSQRLTCILPSGSRTQVSILFIQNGGVLSSPAATISYLQCGIGTYLTTNELSCQNCPQGTYLDTTGGRGVTSCKFCASGFYRNDSSDPSACNRCPQGKYSELLAGDVSGPVNCTDCDVGHFNNFDGRSICADCQPGYYQNRTGQTFCDKCDIGLYNPQAHQSTCLNSTAGYYVASSGSIGQDSCPAGTANNQSTQSKCVDCGPGFVSSSGATDCTPCATGSYTTTSRQRSCLLCENGKYTNSTGRQSCDLCPAGKTSVSNGNQGPSFCLPCDQGKYSGLDGQATCTDCPQGTYANSTGNSQCTTCEIGRHAISTGLINCVNCTAGLFAPAPGVAVCEECEVGKYSLDGASVCTPCPSGSYQDGTGQSTCNPCQKGQAINTPGAPACLDCENGKFSNTTGLSDCIPCPMGTYSTKNNIPVLIIRGATTCTDCSGGTYGPLTGLYACLPCALGFYQDLQGKTECSRCNPGTIASDTQSLTCSNCTAGEYAPSYGLSRCTSCPPGSITAIGGLSACTPCPSGTFQTKSGTALCLDCAPGSYTNSPGQTICKPCQIGTYANQSGLTGCTDCNPGYFQKNPSSTDCTPCYAGTVTGSFAQAACQSCGTGTSQNMTGQTACVSCEPGKASSQSGAINCQDCTKGYFSTEPGALVCDHCPIGKYNADNRSSTCYECSPGSKQPTTGQTTCIKCDSGSAVQSTGQPQCQICADGTFSNAVGQIQCQGCSTGSAVQGFSTGATTCAACVKGFYADVESLAVCKPCPIGTYTDQPSMKSCTRCEVGRYATNSSQTTCQNCDAGYYSNALGAVICSPCDLGYFTNKTGSQNCTGCDQGTYQSSSGNTSCVPCAVGKYADGPHFEICLSCLAGFFTNRTRTSVCDACPSGYYQDARGATGCSGCLIGEYAFNTGASVCTKCDKGYYNKVVNSSNCTLCEGGLYQPFAGQSSCTQCPTGKYSSPDRDVCLPCAAGTVAPFMGSAVCHPCPAHSTSSADSVRCLCDIGYASILDYSPASSDDGYSCRVCPLGGSCTVQGVMWNSMTALPGWWASNKTDSAGNRLNNFYRCPFKDNCLGGTTTQLLVGNSTELVIDEASRCDAHRNGVLCAICDDGYLSVVGGSCQECQSTGATWAGLILIASAVLAAVGALMYVMLQSGRDLMHAAIRHEEYKRREELGFVMDYDPEYHFLANRYGEEITIHGPPPPKPNFTFKLKIVLSFAQILSTMSIGLEIEWPIQFKNFIIWLVPSNLDFVQISTLGCIVHYNYYKKLVIMCLIPPILLSILTIIYLFPKYYKYKKDGVGRKLARRKYWKLLLFFLFLIYPSVSSVVLRTYVCREVEGVWYLLADFTLICYTPEWQTYATFAGFMILVYPLGIPLFFASMIYRYRDRLIEPGVRAELGFLFDAYIGPRWWFESLDMAHKLFVSSIVAFFTFEWQMPAAMVGVVIYTILIYVLKPYIRKSDDRLHLLGQTELLLCILAGNIFNNLEFNPATTSWTVFGVWTNYFRDAFLSAFLILLIVIFFGYFLFQDLQYLIKLYKDRKAAKEKMDAVGAAPNSPSNESIQRSPSQERILGTNGGVELQSGSQFKQKRSDFLPLTHTLTGEKISGMAMVGNPLWNMNAPVHDPEADQIREVHTNPLNEAIKLEDKDLQAYTSNEVMTLAEYAGDGEYVLTKPGDAPVYIKDDGDKLILYHKTVKRKARRDSDPGEDAAPGDTSGEAEYEEEVISVKAKDGASPKSEKPMLRYDFTSGTAVRESPSLGPQTSPSTHVSPKTTPRESRT